MTNELARRCDEGVQFGSLNVVSLNVQPGAAHHFNIMPLSQSHRVVPELPGCLRCNIPGLLCPNAVEMPEQARAHILVAVRTARAQVLHAVQSTRRCRLDMGSLHCRPTAVVLWIRLPELFRVQYEQPHRVKKAGKWLVQIKHLRENKFVQEFAPDDEATAAQCVRRGGEAGEAAARRPGARWAAGLVAQLPYGGGAGCVHRRSSSTRQPRREYRGTGVSCRLCVTHGAVAAGLSVTALEIIPVFDKRTA